MSKGSFILHANHPPAGDQPEAIARLISGLDSGETHQTLKGVTGSGKTFTMANIIHRLERPTLILAHNKTLAAQLYSEMQHFFPENAVEYFVSYYDYYQPEVYIPGTDRFIRKDSAINEHLERLRLSTTKSLIERRDVVVVASVSSIYGLGDPEAYRALQVPLAPGLTIDRQDLIQQLTQLQYTRCERTIERATFRVNGDVIDIFPADSDHLGVRIELFDNNIEQLSWIDPVSGTKLEALENYRVSPKTLYSTPREKIEEACQHIRSEMEQRVAELNAENRIAEAARLYERTEYDIEMMQQLGYCSGIENYSCYLNDRDASLPPTTLMDYLPKDGLLFIDESHVMIPQISAMYRSDKSRKDNLIDYGFRLPSSRNNRPLKFTEFEMIKPQTIFVSATPGVYELEKSRGIAVDQIIRPTGLLDPEVEVRPSENRMDDLLQEIRLRVKQNERVLVTTLTKKSAELLDQFISNNGIKVRTLHSDVKTSDRVEIINGLRAGEFDVLIGINLLREGLDIPEASLVIILDADHAGFLRSVQALIQIIGRAARNANGKAILYADRITTAMQLAMDESAQRRERQAAYNQANGITPTSSKRKQAAHDDEMAVEPIVHSPKFCENLASLCQQISFWEKAMLKAVDNGESDKAKKIRQDLKELYRQFIFI
ncbi:excinuclease ABC subunit UvrB [Endozoicomonas elysicola]|uniref:Excinuclease ABC subunit B n=1 Tax=Endozoicomonas elysicola TaxID=305900 RepID=A0A081KAX8_9GAMM|nr:excinuclease ABC subunit UvrB [Endozoicomonas elysicola]KEI71304.1 excinuclease ABC subunit B [Endozoicomonas elysicola]